MRLRTATASVRICAARLEASITSTIRKRPISTRSRKRCSRKANPSFSLPAAKIKASTSNRCATLVKEKVRSVVLIGEMARADRARLERRRAVPDCRLARGRRGARSRRRPNRAKSSCFRPARLPSTCSKATPIAAINFVRLCTLSPNENETSRHLQSETQKTPRHRRAAPLRISATEMDYDEMSEPNMKLSRALLIVLVLHVVAVSGIIAFNAIKTHAEFRSLSRCRSRTVLRPPRLRPAKRDPTVALAPIEEGKVAKRDCRSQPARNQRTDGNAGRKRAARVQPIRAKSTSSRKAITR